MNTRLGFMICFGIGILVTGCQSAPRNIVPAQSQVIREEFDDFFITGWEKSSSAEATQINVMRVYIEGDGRAYYNRSRPSGDPTPRRPIAADLAKIDPQPHVVYLARPCQYPDQYPEIFKARDRSRGFCHNRYWTTHRFAPDVVRGYHDLLDDLKVRDAGMQFELVGFSGGANIAGILAAQRDDVLNLRTVAGNVDNAALTRFHDVSAMPFSLDMGSMARDLEKLPQIHFIGGQDRIVPYDIFRAFEGKFAHRGCLNHYVVKDAGHHDGWAERWVELLETQRPSCE